MKSILDKVDTVEEASSKLFTNSKKLHRMLFIYENGATKK